ncbi:hypothetical protein CCR75_005384 [Bremia lactucae]|uniref:Uncharacterized protein n=1 Tax=Bremia lactucae TaxID=4779 RepID=A0A976FLS4_BRELC|nr:hypothetical protein CCR75_005384 [Bremia lactucae]
MVLDADHQTLYAGQCLQRVPDLSFLRLCAQDRAAWKDFIETLIAHAPLVAHALLNGSDREKR